MAVAFKTALGNNGNTTSGTSLVITTTAAIAIGDFVVVRWAADNLSATTPTATCTDTGGNTYTAHRQGAVNATAAAGVAGGMLATKATAAVASGQSITLTLSGAVAAKAMYAESFTGVENTLRAAATLASGTATAASSGASTSATANDLVIGTACQESRTAPTGDADSTNGSWSAIVNKPSATSGAAATNAEVSGQYKIVTAAGTQTYDFTADGNEWVAIVAVFARTIIDNPGKIDQSWGNWSATAVGQVPNKIAATITTNWSAPATLLDSYPESNTSGSQTLDNTFTGVGQSFLGNGQVLVRAGFRLTRSGNPDGGIQAVLYTHTGTFGTTGLPQVGVTGSNIVPSTSIVSGWCYFDFDGSYPLGSGTPYYICLETTTNMPTAFSADVDVTSPTHPGIGAYFFSGAWAVMTGKDVIFEVYTGSQVGWTATADGTVTSGSGTNWPATITSDWGTWTATALATVTPNWFATVASSWGVWTATGVASIQRYGTIISSWGVWSATGVGTITPNWPATIASSWGVWTATSIATPSTPAAWGIPQNVNATTTGQTTVTVTWDTVGAATGYDIERNGTVIVFNHPASPYNDSGLTPDTLYTYRVRAVG